RRTPPAPSAELAAVQFEVLEPGMAGRQEHPVLLTPARWRGGPLALEPVEFLLFAGPQGTYFNLVHECLHVVGVGASPRGHFFMPLPPRLTSQPFSWRGRI